MGFNDFEKAYPLYLEGIKSDNPQFSYERLGFLNYWGYACEQIYRTAIRYFTEASLRGSALAHYYLGTMYRDGTGIEKSAVKEHEDAISCLAYMYSKFYDEWQTDDNKSMNYYEQLTQMKSPRVQQMGWYGIGYTYLESDSTDEYNYGITCLKKAAELGSDQAINLLNSL